MKKIRYLILILLFITLLCVPSTAFALGNTLEITCDADGTYKFSPAAENAGRDGTIENPFVISLKYNTVEIDYSIYGKVDFPFYFEIDAYDNQRIGTYIINHDYEEKLVTFNLIETRTSINSSPFYVATGSRKIGDSYLQAGAVLNEMYKDINYIAPIYKIVSYELMSGTWGGKADILMTNLGNAYLNLDTVSGTIAPYGSAYVLAASDEPKNELYRINEFQSGSRLLTNEMNSKFENTGDKEYTMTAPQTVGGNAHYGLDSSNSSKIVYAFFGATSENLDNNEVNGVEKLVSKVLISIGDVFMWVVKKVAGENISLDAFVFNEYEDTIVDYFEPSKGTYTDVITRVVNGWFNAFKYFGLIVMMMILVAIGIKSILYAGTGNQKKISTMIVGWILAVVIMFFGPFLMKYAIKLNDAFVNTIRAKSKYNIYSIYNFEFLDDYQLGEDSETDLITKLEAAREEVSGDKAELQQQMVDLKAVMDEKSNSLFSTTTGILWWQKEYILQTKSVNKYTNKPTKITSKYTITSTIGTIWRGSNTNYDTIEDYIADLWYVSEDGTSNKEFGEDNANLIREYYEAYAGYQEAQQTLKAINKALQLARTTRDLMGEMRTRAGATYRLIYVLVWYVLIYQLVLLMILYYKRLLTIAVLIAIFPLVVMVYAYEKFMGIEKPQSMKTWIMEYAVNVFIQSIHALMYLMLVETGLALYEKDSDNWLLFIFAVTAMFPMENIVKGLLGIKGSTVNSLKTSAQRSVALGASAVAIAKARGKLSDVDKKYDAKEEKVQKKEKKQDQKTALKRQKEENDIRRAALNGGSTEDSKKRLEQLKKQHEKEDKEKEKKRAVAAARRQRNRRLAKGVQVARNVNAKFDAITTGLAGGGDPEDFMAGAAIAGMVAGNTRVSPKDKKKEDAPQKSGNRYSGVSVTNNGSASASEGSGGENGSGGSGSGGNGPGGFGPGGMPHSSFENQNDSGGADSASTNTNTEENKPQVKERVADAIRDQIARQRDAEVHKNSNWSIIDYDNSDE